MPSYSRVARLALSRPKITNWSLFLNRLAPKCWEFIKYSWPVYFFMFIEVYIVMSRIFPFSKQSLAYFDCKHLAILINIHVHWTMYMCDVRAMCRRVTNNRKQMDETRISVCMCVCVCVCVCAHVCLCLCVWKQLGHYRCSQWGVDSLFIGQMHNEYHPRDQRMCRCVCVSVCVWLCECVCAHVRAKDVYLCWPHIYHPPLPRAIRFSKIFSDFCSRGLNHLILYLKRLGRTIRSKK